MTARLIAGLFALLLSATAGLAQTNPPPCAALPASLGYQCKSVPLPINGQCGPANGSVVAAAPTTGLCNQGTPTTVSGTGPWAWTCLGTNGGTTAMCQAMLQIIPPPPGTINAGCVSGAAFCEPFNAPAAVRGRGGDLDASRWATARISGEIISSGQGTANPVMTAPVPACRSGMTASSVYPPNDTLICDAVGKVGRLQTAVAMQNYGVNSYMIRQPFDFAGRTGKVTFDIDGPADLLGGFFEIGITDDQGPATTFREVQNYEVGPVPKNGLSVKFLNGAGCNPGATPYNTMVYNNYVGAIITPTVTNACGRMNAGAMTHFELQVSATHLDVWGSDASTDGGLTFPNFHLVYSATISLPFTRGYIHVTARNHATIKYGFGPDAVFRWDNISFDGPVLPAPRGYEAADNAAMGVYNGNPVMNLGYLLLDGTTGKPAGMYDPVNRVNTLAFANVNTSGMTSATLTLNAFFQAQIHTADLTWGLKYRFNGGTWRNRNLTAGDLAQINSLAGAPLGMLAMTIDVPVADVISGNNTIEFQPLNAPMDYPPVVTNIDLLVNTTGIPPLTGNCGMLSGTPIFCDAFDTANVSTPSRTGGLDPSVWGASRLIGGGVNLGQQQYNSWAASTALQSCGGTVTVSPPNDIAVCGAQLREASNDNPTSVFDAGDVTVLAMYPKQPFDFAGRTGIVSFDVSNDSHGIHSAWPEFWVSNLPVPAPFSHFDSWQTLPQHGFGIRFAAAVGANQGVGTCPTNANSDKPRWTVDSVVVVRNYVMDDTNGLGGVRTAMNMTPVDCVIAPADNSGVTNHVEIKIAQNQIEVWATDAGVPPTLTNLRKIAVVTNANLSFSRGLIWLEDVHYNADKGAPPSQRQHTFVWDNVAFDGPFTYRDFSFDALDDTVVNNTIHTVNLGKVSQPGQTSSWNVLNLPANRQATAVRVLFNFNNEALPPPLMLNVIVNGHAHAVPWPYPDALIRSWRTFAVTIPITDLVTGTNVVQIGSGQWQITSNVNIVLVEVPGGVPVLPGSNNRYPL